MTIEKTTTNLLWDSEIIQKYNVSGPRYTSYPTAPQFKETFTSQQMKSAIQRSNLANRPLSLYFHIPFCSNVCYFCGCNKIVTANRSRSETYLQSVYQELDAISSQINSQRPVEQLHWGGGTPTFISHSQMKDLMLKIQRAFNLLDDDSGEYSVEVHPGNLELETITQLRSLGFNRLSMGIQDFDPNVQKAVNRFNSIDQVRRIIERARCDGFHSISVDLLYGLPKQTEETLAKTIEAVISLSPDRISLFNYAHLPHLFKTQRQICEADLPHPNQKLSMLQQTLQTLQASGYVAIGMDHFAKSNDALAITQQQGQLTRSFQGYSTKAEADTFGFGVSAISTVDNTYWQNDKSIEHYQYKIKNHDSAIAKGIELTHKDLLRRDIINQLMCHFSLDLAAVEQQYSIQFNDHFKCELTELTRYESDQLVTIDERFINVTELGRLLIRNICSVFDAYLNQSPLIAYSKVI